MASEYDWQAEKEADDIIDTMIMELMSSSDEEEEKLTRERKKNKDRNFPLAYATVVSVC